VSIQKKNGEMKVKIAAPISFFLKEGNTLENAIGGRSLEPTFLIKIKMIFPLISIIIIMVLV
jgi:hypothetical protein